MSNSLYLVTSDGNALSRTFVNQPLFIGKNMELGSKPLLSAVVHFEIISCPSPAPPRCFLAVYFTLHYRLYTPHPSDFAEREFVTLPIATSELSADPQSLQIWGAYDLLRDLST